LVRKEKEVVEVMPFAGVDCREKENTCTVHWLQTKQNVTTTIAVSIPKEVAYRILSISPGTTPSRRPWSNQRVETMLEDLLKDSEAEIE
jgi:hypothetical protein